MGGSVPLHKLVYDFLRAQMGSRVDLREKELFGGNFASNSPSNLSESRGA